MDVADIASDLAAEQQALDGVVAQLTDEQWRMPTPSPGWSVADQIAHLAYFDGTAALSIRDPDAFAATLPELVTAAAAGMEAFDDYTLRDLRPLSPPELLATWRSNRAALNDAAATLRPADRVLWYGPSMGAKSFITARLMETWAHGQDVVDALGAARPATERLHHVARLGFNTRGWSYQNRGLSLPDEPVRLELTAPDGGAWTFGPDDAGSVVTGPAEEFCLVVTQRRHLDDTELVTDELGREWLLIAQVFAGPPTGGPEPGTRP
jgi:uncharacterized protein (TIGR03084 family)